MGFWDRVRFEVKAQKTTQEWLSGKAGISFNTFQGWISKERLPDVHQAHAIAQALGVSVEYLVTGSDATDPWLRDNRELVEDLKSLAPEALAMMSAQVRTVANLAKKQLDEREAKLPTYPDFKEVSDRLNHPDSAGGSEMVAEGGTEPATGYQVTHLPGAKK